MLKTARQQTAVYPDAEWMRERRGVGNPQGAHPLNVFKCILVITNLYPHTRAL